MHSLLHQHKRYEVEHHPYIMKLSNTIDQAIQGTKTTNNKTKHQKFLDPMAKYKKERNFVTYKGPKSRWRLISSVTKLQHQVFGEYHTQKPQNTIKMDERREEELKLWKKSLCFAPKELLMRWRLKNNLKHQGSAFKYGWNPNFISFGCTTHHVVVTISPCRGYGFSRFLLQPQILITFF